jgi:hypothetical protein
MGASGRVSALEGPQLRMHIGSGGGRVGREEGWNQLSRRAGQTVTLVSGERQKTGRSLRNSLGFKF